MLLRLCATDLFQGNHNPRADQCIPGWSGFNALVFPDVPDGTVIGYCPMINGSATEFSTIYTVMKDIQSMSRKLEQDDCVITYDLAIYMKAKQIQWKLPEEFSDTVIRMGGFHIALNYLSLLVKKFSNSGLEDILIESGVYGAGATSTLMLGKSYNRGMRAHKLTMEALSRLLMKAFIKWLQQRENTGETTFDMQQLMLRTLEEWQNAARNTPVSP